MFIYKILDLVKIIYQRRIGGRNSVFTKKTVFFVEKLNNSLALFITLCGCDE